MAVHQNEHHQQTQQQQHQQPTDSFLLDALYCEEEQWEEVDEVLDEESERDDYCSDNNNNGTNPTVLPLLLLEQDLLWEDEELLSLFSKEEQTHVSFDNVETDSSLCAARREAVEWMLKVTSFFGFSALTAILSINYLDRFLCGLHYQNDKPWMMHLAAVTCLSLAAKVEETRVPLLVELQVENTKHMFEAKTVQRMELLVLSALQWRMNPVTPLSFLDHIIRRLGLKTHLHWEFLRQCETLLLSVMADWRFVRYLPSVMATATMLHVIHQVDPCNAIQYQNQLLGVLKISEEKVEGCYQLINTCLPVGQNYPQKRKYNQVPLSPSGVIDASFSSDCSNDSWAVGSSASSSPEPPLFKKSRVHEQQMRLPSLSLSRVFVDVIGSPN